MKINKTLVCFTASYPYGNKETYFENELNYLSKYFRKVIIIPEYNPYGQFARIVPENVVVEEVVLRQGLGRLLDFIKYFRFKKIFFSEFFGRKVYTRKSTFRSWLLLVLSYGANLLKFREMNFDSNDVYLYSYWANRYFFIDNELKNYKKVIRMHGGDFYESRNNGYLPVRNELYKSANLLVPISKDIVSRLSSDYNVSKDKIKLSYLGVSNHSKSCALKKDIKLKIVSCSNVYALKRIDLIYEILSAIEEDFLVEWVHIGDGLLLNDIKKKISENFSNKIEVKFVGQKSQEEIKKFYSENYFDFFINTSKFEGLPVSIMEAFSFGIPAIATNVGGTGEIVCAQNGLLIDEEIDVVVIARQIQSLYLSNGFVSMRKEAFNTWNNHFNADKNYQILINNLQLL